MGWLAGRPPCDLARGVVVRDGQLPASLGATALENQASVLGGHALAESVFVPALTQAGLESPLHGSQSLDRENLHSDLLAGWIP